MAFIDLDQLIQLDAGRVHASIYTDSEIFREEMQRIFFTTWVFVGHESEIPRPGSFKTTYVGNVPLILTRADDERIHVLVNRCVHRGATVCQLERGEATAFRCEYHAWTYEDAGARIGISRPDGYAAAERAQFPARGRLVAEARRRRRAGARPWVWFNRGLSAEGRREDGVRTGPTSGEVQQRAIDYEWKRLMSGEPVVPAARALVGGAAR